MGDHELSETTKTDCASSFPSFSELPAELRNEVWKLSLPDTSAPVLVSLDVNSWNASGTEPDLCVEYQLNKRDPIYYQVPLAFVNHEARSIALAWARKHECTMLARDGKDPVFARPFDHKKDAIYLDCIDLVDIKHRYMDRTNEPDLLDRDVDIVSDVEYVVSTQSFLQEPTLFSIKDVFDIWPMVHTWYIIEGTPSNFSSHKSKLGGPRWEITSVEGIVSTWNLEDDCFDYNVDFDDDGGNLPYGSGEASHEFGEALRRGITQFQIRLVDICEAEDYYLEL
ncbi:unnamed protein product [Periconia digitata]|uniref:2EXR domain-containing protein n=1 Tax=Periconia digitata TaxID=1303443 RepID=A0A9W4XVN9_9PLEO|nr:unnamed protein product [Periconia digitata]